MDYEMTVEEMLVAGRNPSGIPVQVAPKREAPREYEDLRSNGFIPLELIREVSETYADYGIDDAWLMKTHLGY